MYYGSGTKHSLFPEYEKDDKQPMNITLKKTLALGAAGLSFLAVTGGASAQTTTGDPALTTVFSTVTNGRNPNFTSTALGVGFDANGGNGFLPSSPTAATAQSVYNQFVFGTSAAGTASTVAAGSTAQIEVFGTNNNVASGAAANTFNIFATLFAFNPNTAANTVLVMGPDLFGAPQQVTLGQTGGGFFSGDFTLTNSLVAGQQYVLGITTLTGNTQDFATVASSSFSVAGITNTADQAFDRTKFLTTANDQGSPMGQPFANPDGNNILAFRILAAAGPAPVPEASSVVSMGLLLGMGAAFIAFKRRRSVAK